MKRNPRWLLIIAALMLLLSSVMAEFAWGGNGPFRLPEGGDTIGGPDTPEGSGKNRPADPGPYFVLPLSPGPFSFQVRIPWAQLLRLRMNPARSTAHEITHD